ncbi:MAG: type II toxin-antitoxin system PemK/MazF family toxin [Bacteroidales bacterium]|nr:type II toxin-antitoxin system PemK/MazF family toxin [Bacteroidales bacterium]
MDQIRTIDKQRITALLGKLSSVEINNLKLIVKELLVD